MLRLSYPAENVLNKDGLKGGTVLLSYSQPGPGRNFLHPMTRLLAHLCTLRSVGLEHSYHSKTVLESHWDSDLISPPEVQNKHFI